MPGFKPEKINAAVSVLSCFAALSFGSMSKAAAAPPEPIPAAAPDTNSIQISELRSATFRARHRRSSIDTIVLHSMCAPSFEDSLSLENCIKTLRRERVGPHYIIDRDGGIYRFADDGLRAPHAGASRMPFKEDRRKHVSDFSIGIEIIGGRGIGYTEAQYSALGKLIKDLFHRHEIKFIVAHKDIALPKGRRWDPDFLFDWSKVRALLGLNPSAASGIKVDQEKPYSNPVTAERK